MKKQETEIEKQFGAVAKEINAKIKEAAKAMKEANKLAKKAGIKYLTGFSPFSDENYTTEEAEDLDELACMIEITPLFEQIDAAGWRTSSIGC